MLPKDYYILLSYVNTKLRDFFSDLTSFCEDEGISCDELIERLRAIGYDYQEQNNQFQKM